MNTAQEKEALLWGVVGVTLFAATLPMTRLAVGPSDAPQLSPWFVTFGRAAVAVNEALQSEPGLINTDPYAGGHIFKIKPSNAAELEQLMHAAAYAAHIG